MPGACVRPLLEFECRPVAFNTSSSSSSSAADTEAEVLSIMERVKGEGNELFKLKDYTAALEHYRKAISLLQKTYGCSVGVDVLVRPKGAGGFRPATISDCNSSSSGVSVKSVDVMYNDGDEEDEEGVALSRVIVLRPACLTVQVFITAFL